MGSCNAQKTKLRIAYRNRRREHIAQNSAIREAVKVHLLKSLPTCGYLGLYWPLATEVDLRPLRQVIAQPMALPFADGEGGLTYRAWNDESLMADGCGIPAPIGNDLSPEQLSLLIVPALAVDQHGIRLGYGGGYYDRLRAKDQWRMVPAVVVLPQACLVSTPLPCDPWDIPFDGWITELGSSQAASSPAS